MCDAINAVRGGTYDAKQGVFLLGSDTVRYPVSGSSDDWAYARHIVDSSNEKVYSFGLEFGYAKTSFHIPWLEMSKTIPEIDAAMLELCVVAATPITLGRIKNLIPWWAWEIFALGRLPTQRVRPPRPRGLIQSLVSLAVIGGLLFGLAQFSKKIRSATSRLNKT